MLKKFEDYIRYDSESGKLFWIKAPARRCKVGGEVGWIDNTGYIRLVFNSKRYLAHRVIWYIYYGAWPKDEIDHINRNYSDNRISNLREVDRSGNMHNVTPGKNNKTGYRGISYMQARKKYIVQIVVNKKNTYLGLYKTLDEAIKVRLDAEERLLKCQK